MNKRGLITKWVIIIAIILAAAYFVLDYYDYGVVKLETAPEQQGQAVQEQAVPASDEIGNVAEKSELPAPPEEKPTCTKDADCTDWKQCIDQKCQRLTDVYQTDCENTCTYTGATFLTSDGETYIIKKGQGSYSYAGALEWKLVAPPRYCPAENVPVSLKLVKKDSGKIIEEETITLKKGETSGEITHSAIPDVSFTMTLQDVVEECG